MYNCQHTLFFTTHLSLCLSLLQLLFPLKIPIVLLHLLFLSLVLMFLFPIPLLFQPFHPFFPDFFLSMLPYFKILILILPFPTCYGGAPQWECPFFYSFCVFASILGCGGVLTVVLEFTLNWRCMTPHTYVITPIFITITSIYTMFIIILHLISLCLSYWHISSTRYQNETNFAFLNTVFLLQLLSQIYRSGIYLGHSLSRLFKYMYVLFLLFEFS